MPLPTTDRAVLEAFQRSGLTRLREYLEAEERFRRLIFQDYKWPRVVQGSVIRFKVPERYKAQS